MKNALDCYYDYKLDKFILLEDIKYKNNRDINLLIEELRQYTNSKNEQDINSEKERLKKKENIIGNIIKSIKKK